MNELRWNPLAGQWVTIATERAARPSTSHPGSCPWSPSRRVTSVAGYEEGTGALINLVAPEIAAQQLRRQDPTGL